MWHGKVFAGILYPDRTLHLTQTRRTQCTQRHSQLGHLVGERYYMSIGGKVSDRTFLLRCPCRAAPPPRATPLAGYANASKRCTRKTLHGKDSVWTILRRSRVPTRGYEAVGRR
jgi:hypothetical protein